ncbi:hypothetical protein PGT21_013810 [Puccinia graminis f. sp. tritici]|uniref:Uncharacterized protein n=1 Tax=Puccinia graminis f. sp. tritici TaxID=56615 RepID=A0A5B0R0G6_PUCGR|nr:hypothetical protein PGT21_013810 [Puccinia graminis f. sp. tritici]
MPSLTTLRRKRLAHPWFRPFIPRFWSTHLVLLACHKLDATLPDKFVAYLKYCGISATLLAHNNPCSAGSSNPQETANTGLVRSGLCGLSNRLKIKQKQRHMTLGDFLRLLPPSQRKLHIPSLKQIPSLISPLPSR